MGSNKNISNSHYNNHQRSISKPLEGIRKARNDSSPRINFELQKPTKQISRPKFRNNSINKDNLNLKLKILKVKIQEANVNYIECQKYNIQNGSG